MAPTTLLALAGMVIAYSTGFDHGTCFVDHGRNILLAAIITLAVAQVPPQRLMSLAWPSYGRGAMLVAVALFGFDSVSW